MDNNNRAFLILFLYFGFPMLAQAYLDPGTGSFMLQLLFAGVLAGIFYLKIFWTRVKSITSNFGRRCRMFLGMIRFQSLNRHHFRIGAVLSSQEVTRYRGRINSGYKHHYDQLMQSGLYERLTNESLLYRTRFASSLLAHVHMHARAQSRFANRTALFS